MNLRHLEGKELDTTVCGLRVAYGPGGRRVTILTSELGWCSCLDCLAERRVERRGRSWRVSTWSWEKGLALFGSKTLALAAARDLELKRIERDIARRTKLGEPLRCLGCCWFVPALSRGEYPELCPVCREPVVAAAQPTSRQPALLGVR